MFRERTGVEIAFLVINLILGSHCFTSIFLLPWAMIPNVLDEYLLKYGNKLDALFYTFYSLGVKILISLFAGLTQLVLGYFFFIINLVFGGFYLINPFGLSVAGFVNNQCTQNESVGNSVRLLMSVGPLIACVLGSIVIFFYPITRERAEENSRKVKLMTK